MYGLTLLTDTILYKSDMGKNKETEERASSVRPAAAGTGRPAISV